MVFAGLWDTWKSPAGEVIESCTILTTASNRILIGLHDRMPVILSRDEYAAWLDRQVTNPARLVHIYPADLMETCPVSPLVNNAGNDSADLIQSARTASALGINLTM
jgi:putative SOS response-associated peptidase YedK